MLLGACRKTKGPLDATPEPCQGNDVTTPHSAAHKMQLEAPRPRRRDCSVPDSGD